MHEKLFMTRQLVWFMFRSTKTVSQTGFTLVELIIVIVLLGILSVAALPRFFSTNTYKEYFFFYELLNSVRYAQKVAVATGCHVQVATDANAVVLRRRAGCTNGLFSVDVIDPSMRATRFEKVLPSGVTLSPANIDIYFDSIGRARNTASSLVQNFVIALENREFTVVGETGYSYVSR